MFGGAALQPVPKQPPVSAMAKGADHGDDRPIGSGSSLTLFLAGDVMLGRGIDQILPHPGDPRIYEEFMPSATGYVELAEKASGPIPRLADFDYVWGDALSALQDARPTLRIVNLETSITTSDQPLPKGINYRMNPANIGALSAAKPDCCVLANNHVLDWGRPGLLETLDTLQKAGIQSAGAGRSAAEASAPAIFEVAGKGRVLVFAFGAVSSGIPLDWAAGDNEPGINLLEDLSSRSVERIARRTRAARQPRDIIVASIHWGGNWGYKIPNEWRTFAHRLIDEAGVDIIHAHSSHHPRGIELYKQKLILYGCGDFLDDYEGIAGYEAFRAELVVMFLPTVSLPDGGLVELRMAPFRIRRFRLARAANEDAAWLYRTLARESAKLGTRVTLRDDFTLAVSQP